MGTYGLMSKTGVPSTRSNPETRRYVRNMGLFLPGTSCRSVTTPSNLAKVNPIGLNRCGDRVAKTPTLELVWIVSLLFFPAAGGEILAGVRDPRVLW